ncbi:MAG: PAS domain S-box protein [Chloroflexi bacterium]|nr:PAS domain S-box protein [Chloroflexota bacterium]
MLTMILFVMLEREMSGIRNMAQLAFAVSIFKSLLFFTVDLSLRNDLIIKPYVADNVFFHLPMSTLFLGAALMFLQLFIILSIFKYLQKRISKILTLSLLYTATFIIIISMDGVFFPLIELGFSPELKIGILGDIKGKFILAISYGLPLLLFTLVFHKKIAGYSEMKFHLSGLLDFSRDRLIEEVNLQREAVEASEKKYRELVELAQEGIWVIDSDSRTTFVNPSMEKMLNYDEGEMLGKELFSFMDERGAEIAKKKLDLRQEGIAEQYDLEFIRKDGERRIVTMQAAPIIDEDGDYAGAIAGVIDITERKFAEEILQAEAQRNEKILNTMLDGFVFADADGNILRVNPAYSEMMGYSEKELLQMNMRELDVKLSSEEVDRRIEQMVSFGSDRFETQHKHKKGHVIDLDISVSMMQLGETPLVAAFMRDITENKKAVKTLEQSEMRLRKYFEQELLGMAITSSEKVWIEANDALCEMFGYSHDELSELTWAEITHPEDLDTNFLLFEKMMAGEIDSYSLEKRFLRKDGSLVYAELSASPVRKDDGSLDFLITLINDVTERKQAEDQKTQYMYELAILNELGNMMRESLSQDHIVNTAISGILEATASSMVFLLLRNGKDFEVAGKKFSHLENENIRLPTHIVESCLCGLAIRDNQPVYSKNIPTDKRCAWNECKDIGMISGATLPLYSDDEVIGVLGLGNTEIRDYELQSSYLETLASTVSLSLQNARLYQKVREDAAELDKRVEERTQRLNNMVELMSGREVRMAELKKVITTLRTQLKEEGVEPSAYDPLLGPDKEW